MSPNLPQPMPADNVRNSQGSRVSFIGQGRKPEPFSTNSSFMKVSSSFFPSVRFNSPTSSGFLPRNLRKDEMMWFIEKKKFQKGKNDVIKAWNLKIQHPIEHFCNVSRILVFVMWMSKINKYVMINTTFYDSFVFWNWKILVCFSLIVCWGLAKRKMQNVAATILVKALFFCCNWFSCSNQSCTCQDKKYAI